jgi:hypothetical protein
LCPLRSATYVLVQQKKETAITRLKGVITPGTFGKGKKSIELETEVWSGVSKVSTKQSGVAHLACALLRPTCALCKPSVHFVDFATCALPKCTSRVENPTFAPYLHTLFSALESYSLFLRSILSPVIAGLRPHNLHFANKQYYSFQINLIFPPPREQAGNQLYWRL